MALENTGLPNGGVTANYKFLYDSSLAGGGGPEPARTTQLMQNCDADFLLMQSWFTGVTFPFSEPMEADVQGGGGTASWGPPVDLNASTNDAGYLRMLLIAEVTEMFMKSQAAALHTSGWFPGNEGSLGEGLSRFLAEQFLIQSGVGIGEFPGWGFTANSWLTSPDWPDWVNNVDPTGDLVSIEIGCSILFIYYLFTNLNFTINQVIGAAAANLAGVFSNLTGDSGDPFPFFKRLLKAYPGTAGITTGTNLDNPFPVGLVSIWEEKSTFGYDEVQDVIAQNNGVFSAAFWIVIEGFSKNSFNALGITVQLNGSLTTTAGITVSQSATYAIDFEDADKPDAPQRIRIPYDIRFTAAADPAFPSMGSTAENELDLHAELQIGGQKVNASDAYAAFELVAGADPYFTNVDPAQGNVFYLSQDLRVFTVTPDLDPSPIAGVPAFVGNDTNGAYGYIQGLLGHLNGNSNYTAGTADPFATFPDQSGAYTGDSSVTPVTLTSPPHNNFNFAVARVRLRGSPGAAGAAHNVKVFFRLWVSQSADTDYQPNTTYLSTPDMAGFPGAPVVGAGTTTIPFFATGNLGTNSDYGPSGINDQTITIDAGDTAWAYFGCFIDVYDLGYLVNGQPVQTWLAGTHHCLVAQIACDTAPIPTGAAQVTPSPENSDKLAQRNLQVTLSDNPGGPATHRIPQTLDVRPSPAGYAADPAQMPDELMIDWGAVPVGAVARIYWPQVNAADVIRLADAHYAFHALETADQHTIQCKVTRSVTYLPIPPSAGENFAGLLTIDMPLGIRTGQAFDVVVRRVVTARAAVKPPPPPPPPPPRVARGARAARAAAERRAPAATHGFGPGTTATHGFRPEPEEREAPPAVAMAAPGAAVLRTWRYTTGAFRVHIPVSEPREMLPLEENTLAIMKWRLGALPLSNRWYPVLRRYVEYIEGRVRGLGGHPDKIKPSPGGYPVVLPEPGRETHDYCGKVCRITFDCHGDFEGFELDECAADHCFETRDPGLGELVLRALRDRLRLRVVVRLPGRRIVRVEVLE
jgi:hypothetical protein